MMLSRFQFIESEVGVGEGWVLLDVSPLDWTYIVRTILIFKCLCYLLFFLPAFLPCNLKVYKWKLYYIMLKKSTVGYLEKIMLTLKLASYTLWCGGN